MIWDPRIFNYQGHNERRETSEEKTAREIERRREIQFQNKLRGVVDFAARGHNVVFDRHSGLYVCTGADSNRGEKLIFIDYIRRHIAKYNEFYCKFITNL